MLSAILSGRRMPLGTEHGFSMIEMVVTLAVGAVVMTALLTILYVTFHQSVRTFTKVDATERARVGLAKVESELQSACLTSGVTPIQAGTTSSNLIFVSANGNAAQPTPVEHQLSFSSSSGTLTDAQYAVTGGAAPNWTFASTPYQTTTLLTAVTQSGAIPVFQYFAYQEAPNGSGGYYTDGAGNPYMMLLDGSSSVPGTSPPVIPTAAPLPASPPSGLSSVNAQSTAEVLVTMKVGPAGSSDENTSLADGPLTVTDSVVLRLTPPPNNANGGATFAPCS